MLWIPLANYNHIVRRIMKNNFIYIEFTLYKQDYAGYSIISTLLRGGNRMPRDVSRDSKQLSARVWYYGWICKCLPHHIEMYTNGPWSLIEM